MRRNISIIAWLLVAVLLTPSAFATGYSYQRGYVTKRGKFVPGHYQTAPNNTRLDNWSTRGNVNPITGKQGTKPSWLSRLFNRN